MNTKSNLRFQTRERERERVLDLGVCRAYTVRMDARIWIWVIKNTLKSRLTQLNAYNILRYMQKSARSLNVSRA